MVEPKPDEPQGKVKFSQIVGKGGEVDDSNMTSEESAIAVRKVLELDRLPTEVAEYLKVMFGSRYTKDEYLAVAKGLIAKTASILKAQEQARVEKVYDEVEAYIDRDLVWASEEDEMLWKDKLKIWRQALKKEGVK